MIKLKSLKLGLQRPADKTDEIENNTFVYKLLSAN